MVCPPSVPNEQTFIKNKIKAQRRQEQTTAAAKLRAKPPSNLKQAMDSGGEKGASHWLVALSLSENGFTLHKGSSVQRRHQIEVWMAASTPTVSLHMWKEIHSGTCLQLSLWWISFSETQRHQRHHCGLSHRSLS